MNTAATLAFQLNCEMVFPADWDLTQLRDAIATRVQVDSMSIRLHHGRPAVPIAPITRPICELVGGPISIRASHLVSKQQAAHMRVARRVKGGYENARSTAHIVAVGTKVDGLATAVGGVATAVEALGSTRTSGSLYASVGTSGN